jgi:hypothetical protein
MGHTLTHHQQCYQLDSVLKLRSLQLAKITGAELCGIYYYSTLLSYGKEKTKQLMV